MALRPNQNGTPIFDWNQIRGLGVGDNFNDPDVQAQQSYCLGQDTGQAQCELPITDQAQPFSMSFDNRLIESVAKPTNRLELIIGGDNDRTDCQHSGLNLEVIIDYSL